jgi:MATE family multidrug resistance protein
MIAMWGANVVNLLLNLWLVPGGNVFATSGAVASGWATFVSRVALLVFVWALIARWPQARALGVFTRAPRDPVAAAEMRRVGYGASVSYTVEAGSFAAMSIIAGWLGALAVASWAIVLNLAALIFMVPLGLSTATSVFVGRAHGAGDAAGVRRAAALGFRATLVMTLLICGGVAFGNHALAAGYTADRAVQAVAAAALLLSCLFYVADGLQVVAAQALRARGDIWMPTATHFTSYILIMMPAGYLFAVRLWLGVNGLVWAIILASLVSAALLWGRFLWLDRVSSAAPRSG